MRVTMKKKKKTLMISLFIRVPCDTLQKREKVTVGGGGECVSKCEKKLVQVSSACPRFIFCRRREKKLKSEIG